ncbi:MAG TPA: hypothetical protein VJC11_01840 [Patescibacteria group bacterium]|nr:hypothetical protein [Patescibacteria group bacterium]
MSEHEYQSFHTETGEENLPFQVVVGQNGNTLEVYDDSKNKGVFRYYLRKVDGELLEFGDTRAIEGEHGQNVEVLLRHVVRRIEAHHTHLTDDEIETLRKKIDRDFFVSPKLGDNLTTH